MRNVLTGSPLARRLWAWIALVTALALFLAVVSSASAAVSVSSSWGTPSWSVTSIGSIELSVEKRVSGLRAD